MIEFTTVMYADEDTVFAEGFLDRMIGLVVPGIGDGVVLKHYEVLDDGRKVALVANHPGTPTGLRRIACEALGVEQ